MLAAYGARGWSLGALSACGGVPSFPYKLLVDARTNFFTPLRAQYSSMFSAPSVLVYR